MILKYPYASKGPIYPINLENQYDKQVYLLLHNNHYDVITSPEAFFNIDQTANYHFCNGCKKKCLKTHKCDLSGKELSILCSKCGKKHPQIEDIPEIKCTDCLRYFNNKLCYENHKMGLNKSICKKIRVCEDCGILTKNKIMPDEFKIDRRKKNQDDFKKLHICGKYFCNSCYDFVDKENHKCHISKLTDRDFKKYAPTTKIIWYDYETYLHPETKEHIPNLIIAYRSDPDNIEEYTKHTFSCYESANVNKDFCNWLFNNDNKGYTCMAHNSKGYDIHLIKKFLYNSDCPLKFNCIDTGNKTMCLTIPSLKMKFIDSLNFFMSPLAALPKTYGFNEQRKGYFPHFFNKPENWAYIGDMPDKHYYGYETMKNQKDFDVWYNKQTIFNFKQDFIEYCHSDVEILRTAWLKYRQLFLDICCKENPEKQLDPTKFITLASLCNAIYRAYFMPKKSIAILNDFNPSFSIEEIEYLYYIEKSNGITLEKQYKIGSMYVDGYNKETNTVYQYNGCYFHGCKYCYSRDIMNSQNGKSMDMLLRDTLKKKQKLLDLGYNVIGMWSHK